MKLRNILAAAAMMLATAATAQTVNQAAIDNILTRSSIRTFQQRPVEADKIQTILKAGLSAPSSRDMRPWHLVVISDKAAIEKYASGNPRHGDKIKATPLIIIVCGDKNQFQQGEAEPYWTLDCSCVAENILLAAHAQGLGAYWGSVYPAERKMNGIKRNLQLPDNLIPFASISIGYAAEEADIKDKWDESKITYWK